MKKQYVWAAGVAAAAVLIGFAVTLRSTDGQLLLHRQAEMDSSGSMVAHSPAMASFASVGTGGGSGGGMGGGTGGGPAAAPAVPGANKAATVTDEAEESAKLTLASMSDSQVDRYLIKNATVVVEAKDVIKAADSAKAFAKSANGYVSSLHESVDNLGLKNVALEVRVPASQFDAAMQSVAGLGRVMDSQVTSEDVTEQYVDTDAQVRNLKMTEGRLLEHLSRTGKLSDTLLVETELTRVRESLNELEGKLRFMSHRVSYSTISLTFKEPAHIEPIAPTESFSMGQVTSQAMRSFTGFLQSVISVGIWVLIWSVLWAPIAVVGRIVWVRQRGRLQTRS